MGAASFEAHHTRQTRPPHDASLRRVVRPEEQALDRLPTRGIAGEKRLEAVREGFERAIVREPPRVEHREAVEASRRHVAPLLVLESVRNDGRTGRDRGLGPGQPALGSLGRRDHAGRPAENVSKQPLVLGAMPLRGGSPIAEADPRVAEVGHPRDPGLTMQVERHEMIGVRRRGGIDRGDVLSRDPLEAGANGGPAPARVGVRNRDPRRHARQRRDPRRPRRARPRDRNRGAPSRAHDLDVGDGVEEPGVAAFRRAEGSRQHDRLEPERREMPREAEGSIDAASDDRRIEGGDDEDALHGGIVRQTA